LATRARDAHGFELAGVGAENHAADPKGKNLELLRKAEGADAELTTMMAEIHGPIVGEQAITPFLKTGFQKPDLESMPLVSGGTLKPNHQSHTGLTEICR
jgi:hypothetical protein